LGGLHLGIFYLFVGFHNRNEFIDMGLNPENPPKYARGRTL